MRLNHVDLNYVEQCFLLPLRRPCVSSGLAAQELSQALKGIKARQPLDRIVAPRQPLRGIIVPRWPLKRLVKDHQLKVIIKTRNCCSARRSSTSCWPKAKLSNLPHCTTN